MKFIHRKAFLSITLAVGLLNASGWSAKSYACSSDPILAGICIMASVRNGSFNGYVLADGATLQVDHYQALYSLIGNTYGGQGTTDFQLPDLRGRVVIGAGQGPGLPFYKPGDTGGATGVILNGAQLPPHAHALTTAAGGVTVTSSTGTLAAHTTLSGLTAATTVGTLAAKNTLSGLAATLEAASGSGASSDATAASLPSSKRTSLYPAAAPDVAMNSGSVTFSGFATLTGTPATTTSGSPTTVLSGSPLVTVGGLTDLAGTGSPVATMPPYLSLNYYIAINGIYPSYE